MKIHLLLCLSTLYLTDATLPNVIQYGKDGFGHQLEGLMGTIAMHVAGKVNYIFDYPRTFKFEHKNVDGRCQKYMEKALSNMLAVYPQRSNITEREHVHEVWNIPKTPNPNVIYSIDNAFYEPVDNLLAARNLLRQSFVLNNPYLPKPTYDVSKRNVVVHIRRGDAVTQGRTHESDKLLTIVEKFQGLDNDWFITIHTNGDVKELNDLRRRKTGSTFIYDGNVHALQVLSDFIYADVLVISESALSIAATWLGDPVTSQVIGPSPGGDGSVNLEGRIRPGYETYQKSLTSTLTYEDNNTKQTCGHYDRQDFEDYMNATFDALHPRSLLRGQIDTFPIQCFPVKSSFFAVGMEASGHHLMMKVPKDMYVGKGAQALSFPECGCQRAVPDANQCNFALKIDTKAWTFPKYLILLRDPKNQFLSTLQRYWDPKQFSLSTMYDMWISAASQMQIFINSLIAQKAKIMVVSYEILTNRPEAHKKPFHYFFGVSSSTAKKKMDEWSEQIRTAGKYDLNDISGFSECDWSWGRWRKRDCTQENIEAAFESAFYMGQKEKIVCGEKKRNETLYNLYNAFSWPDFMYL